MNNFYRSQYEQDRILNETYFKNKVGGVFVDIGAHDGETLSNTFFYEKALNWKGLCIEPLPKVFKQLEQKRSCALVEGAAWNENTTKTFRLIEGYSEMLSGLVDTYPQDHINRIESETKQSNQTVTDIDVKCYSILELLLQNNLTEIDFLSIDVEGSELEILKSIDYDKIKIKVILAENNYSDSNLRSFLVSKGYHFANRIAIDDVFILSGVYETE